ncbi:MAG: hypothetical protein R2991_10955 [Thermoanaerobaculia bacterium]
MESRRAAGGDDRKQPAGAISSDFGSATVFVSTDNGLGLTDEVFRDRLCPEGPAILGLCDPLVGTPVVVNAGAIPVSGIDFALEGLLFADGFESGDASAWSTVVP